MTSEIINNELFLLVEKEIYNENVLHKCFYWYGANFNVEVSNYSKELFRVKIRAKDETEDLQKVLERIQRDLIDFKLRDIVTNETKNIRELLVAKAFAYYDSEGNPTTEVSDPVGFNPEKI